MTRKLKSVEIELADEVQQAVLSLPVQGGEGLTTVGLLVSQAQEALRLANEAVRSNALIQLTADHLMRGQNRRGTPCVTVRLDGTVSLLIGYGETPPTDAPPTQPTKRLPSLDTLRETAQAQGVDISDLGRQKLRIMERLGVTLR